MLDVLLGSAVLTGKFNHVTPFHRRIHAIIYAAKTIEDLKSGLFDIDPACPTMDPTRVVNRYLDPWWITPSLSTEFLSLLDGVPDFIVQVCF